MSDQDQAPADPKPGDTFVVTLDGVRYRTCISSQGTQRFPENPDHPLLLAAPKIWYVGLPVGEVAPDLNEMCIRYQRGEFSQRDYAEMNMALGYSVSGFCDVSDFHDMRLANELWGEDIDDPLAGIGLGYLSANVEKGVLSLSQAVDMLAFVEDCDLVSAAEKLAEFMGEEEDDDSIFVLVTEESGFAP